MRDFGLPGGKKKQLLKANTACMKNSQAIMYNNNVEVCSAYIRPHVWRRAVNPDYIYLLYIGIYI